MQLDACYCIPHYLNNLQLTIHVCAYMTDTISCMRVHVCISLLAILILVLCCVDIGVRANIHLGGQTEFCPNGFSGGGG